MRIWWISKLPPLLSLASILPPDVTQKQWSKLTWMLEHAAGSLLEDGVDREGRHVAGKTSTGRRRHEGGRASR